MKRETKIFILIVVAVFLVLWLVLSAIYKCDFWCVTFKDWISIVLTIFIGIIIAYVLTEKIANKRLFLDAYISKLNALHITLEACRDSIFNDYMKKDFNALILSNNKIISNSIELLSRYAKKMDIQEEFSFILSQYSEFKTITTDYIASLKDEEHRNKASLKINLMIGKLNEIELKLFESL